MSTKSTTRLFFLTNGDTTTIAQVIPWAEFKVDPITIYKTAIQNGWDPYGGYIHKQNEGYIIDPNGYLVLLAKKH